MATRLLTRSKSLNPTLLNTPCQFLRPLHSLTAPRDLGTYQPPDSRSPPSRFVPKPDLAASSSSPSVSFILGSKKILGYEKTLPRWFSADAQGKLNSPISPTKEKEVTKVVEPGKDVTCFSPLEAISIRPRSSILGNESSKINRIELSQNITLALAPALLLISKSSITTSLLVLSVYWQIYGFFKEIFLDYVHQEVTRKWVLTYFKILLLILIKDTFIDFGLV